MLKALKKEVRNNEILLHLHHFHTPECWFISYLFKDYPIVIQHHGCSSPIVIFQKKKNPLYLLAYYLIDKPTLKYVDYLFVIAKGEMEFLSHIVDLSRLTLQGIGVDFEEFKPMDKIEARKKLNISLDKKVMLYVGKYYKLKGVDVILKAFKKLKEKYDVELILIGGRSYDEFYNDAKSLGARVYATLPHDTLPLYFSVADVYLLTSFDKNLVSFGGFGISPEESLACGTPIVSSQLIHFPDDEWKSLGKIPKNEDDVIKCVSDIFDDPSPYKNCREVARKYFDWKPIIENTIKVYDRLFREYYE
jgi:glycosyltransferase involved in cell wall biosynthesis